MVCIAWAEDSRCAVLDVKAGKVRDIHRYDLLRVRLISLFIQILVPTYVNTIVITYTHRYVATYLYLHTTVPKEEEKWGDDVV